ncbi:hypothetical protein C2G38_991902 [Gigaspora rosea]|uniref:Uncharacterized protein n=1 Tax=Gigaspora rosea TaxID=44941 RepID=A0A397TUM5_9GLOM|nr:hypothetical protein C2G38_991902 [Gigaspora rosea]
MVDQKNFSECFLESKIFFLSQGCQNQKQLRVPASRFCRHHKQLHVPAPRFKFMSTKARTEIDLKKKGMPESKVLPKSKTASRTSIKVLPKSQTASRTNTKVLPKSQTASRTNTKVFLSYR